MPSLRGLRQLRRAIDTAIAEGLSFEEIDREILTEDDLGEEARDALWLYAWGSYERAQRGLPLRPREITNGVG
jgi:hypothetical protein